MMWKSVALGIALGLSAIGVYSVTDAVLLPVFFPVDPGALQFSSVDLGEMRIDESRDFTVRVTNPTLRSLVLAAPATECGCILVDGTEATIRRKSAAMFTFRFRAPSAPGEVLKTIVFAARDFPDWRWQVPVTANVTAAAWTDPPALDFALDHNDEATRTKRIVLHRRKDVAIGRVVASQPGVIVKTRNATNESLQLEINISSAADKSGEALAQVFDPAGTSQLLAIPITWRPRPWLRCVPQELVLDRSTNASRIHKKRIMLLTCLKQKETIKAEPLVSWITAETVEVTGYGLLITLLVDMEAAPGTFNDAVIRFTAEEEPNPAFLPARF